MGNLSPGAIAGIVVAIFVVVAGITLGIIFGIGGGSEPGQPCTPGTCPSGEMCDTGMICELCSDHDLDLTFDPISRELTYTPIPSPETGVYTMAYTLLDGTTETVTPWTDTVAPPLAVGNYTLTTETSNCPFQSITQALRPCGGSANCLPGSTCFGTVCLNNDTFPHLTAQLSDPTTLTWTDLDIGTYVVFYWWSNAEHATPVTNGTTLQIPATANNIYVMCTASPEISRVSNLLRPLETAVLSSSGVLYTDQLISPATEPRIGVSGLTGTVLESGIPGSSGTEIETIDAGMPYMYFLKADGKYCRNDDSFGFICDEDNEVDVDPFLVYPSNVTQNSRRFFLNQRSCSTTNTWNLECAEVNPTVWQQMNLMGAVCAAGSCGFERLCGAGDVCIDCDTVDLNVQATPYSNTVTFDPLLGPEDTGVYQLSYVESTNQTTVVVPDWNGGPLANSILGDVEVSTDTVNCTVSDLAIPLQPCDQDWVGCNGFNACGGNYCIPCAQFVFSGSIGGPTGRTVFWDNMDPPSGPPVVNYRVTRFVLGGSVGTVTLTGGYQYTPPLGVEKVVVVALLSSGCGIPFEAIIPPFPLP